MLPWKIYICTSEVSVSCCLFVDWSSQVKHLDDSRRTKIEIITDDLYQFHIRNFSCSKCFYMNRCRMSYTDRIGKLNFAFVSKSCCYDILSYITSCICCRTVNLCAVLSRESSAAVTSGSAVSINDDLTSCKSTVTVRSADYKTSCRIDEVFCILVYHISRDDLIKYIFLNVLMDLLLSYIRVMLCRAYNCIDTDRFAFFTVFNSYLSFSVWS